MKKHISFSELSTWHKCPYAHKLQYIDGIDLFEDNEFMSFGKAIHKTAEIQVKSLEEKNWQEIFELAFLQYLMEMKKKNPQKQLDENLILEMRSQGRFLSPIITSSLKEFFGDFEVIDTEKYVYEEIKNLEILGNYDFKGFIDLIIKTKKDNKIIILDYKSCSWGWDGRKKNDKITTYQLTYYKHFYSQKYNIDPENIETYFCLLKRTAKKNQVEIFRVTSGEKKVKNALQLLEKAINSIQLGKHWKNKKHCGECIFNNSEFCKK